MNNSNLTKQKVRNLGYSPKKNVKQFPPELEFECNHKFQIKGKYKFCVKCGDRG